MALLEEYARVAQVLSAPARLGLLEHLAQAAHNVESLAEKTGLTGANCSHHLQQLRRCGLVTCRPDGKTRVYQLADEKLLELMGLLRVVAERNLAQVERLLRELSGGQAPPEPMCREELARRLTEGSVTVLDVRPCEEFARGHIPGAINVTLGDIDDLASTLDPGTEIVAYCRGPYCTHADLAVAALRQQGFLARRLDGGVPEWRADGRALHPA